MTIVHRFPRWWVTIYHRTRTGPFPRKGSGPVTNVVCGAVGTEGFSPLPGGCTCLGKDPRGLQPPLWGSPILKITLFGDLSELLHKNRKYAPVLKWNYF